MQLKRLMTLLNIDPSDGDIIVDSILDWIDPDDLTRLNGAKTDYYMSLSPPYRAKNAPLDRVDELLLIRGVTPELFHGTPATDKDPAQPGLADVFTTMSSGTDQREHGVAHRAAGHARAQRRTGASRADPTGRPRRHPGHGR